MLYCQCVSDKDFWSCILSLVFFGFFCYVFFWLVFVVFLLIFMDDMLVLCIQGFNIIGVKFLLVLVEGLMEEEGLEDICCIFGEWENEFYLFGKSCDGCLVRVELFVYGLSIGFVVFFECYVEFVVVLCFVKDSEVCVLVGFGDLCSLYVEQVIVIDGLVIILYLDNLLVLLDIV